MGFFGLVMPYSQRLIPCCTACPAYSHSEAWEKPPGGRLQQTASDDSLGDIPSLPVECAMAYEPVEHPWLATKH